MAEKLKSAAGAFERVMLPRLNSIDGELKALNGKVDSFNGEVRAEIRVVDTKVSEMDKRVTSRLDEMDKRLTSRLDEIESKLDIDRRMTIMEAKLKDLEKRS